MFAAIFHRAQAAVDNAVDGLIDRAIIALPFLIAGGFETAALYLRLTRDYGAETANLILAAGFAILGLLCFALAGRTPSAAMDQGTASQTAREDAIEQQRDGTASSTANS